MTSLVFRVGQKKDFSETGGIVTNFSMALVVGRAQRRKICCCGALLWHFSKNSLDLGVRYRDCTSRRDGKLVSLVISIPPSVRQSTDPVEFIATPLGAPASHVVTSPIFPNRDQASRANLQLVCISKNLVADFRRDALPAHFTLMSKDIRNTIVASF